MIFRFYGPEPGVFDGSFVLQHGLKEAPSLLSELETLS
jgi:hypothetical protein